MILCCDITIYRLQCRSNIIDLQPVKAAFMTVIGCGMEESWGIVLIHKCLQKHVQSVLSEIKTNSLSIHSDR